MFIRQEVYQKFIESLKNLEEIPQTISEEIEKLYSSGEKFKKEMLIKLISGVVVDDE